MQRQLAALILILLLGMVLGRSLLMRREGIRALHFGNIDKTDFLIPPFAAFYFYIVFAAAFGFPSIAKHRFFQCAAISWAGVFFCVAGLVVVFLSLGFLRRSFRAFVIDM